MILRGAGVLLGEDLKYVSSVGIRISRGRFQDVGAGVVPGMDEEAVDCEGLLAIPGMVNCHTHVGDSIAKDLALDGTVDDRVHPVSGAKARVLSRTRSEHIVQLMRAACRSMVRRGTTTFVDFREGGKAGVLQLREAVRGLGIRPVILGRVEHYQSRKLMQENAGLGIRQREELDGVLQCCDGLGISGANENSDAVLAEYARTSKIRAIHAAETEQSIRASHRATGRSEVERALQARPHFVVHMTHATVKEIHAVARQARGVVVCPRANGALAGGVPDVETMIRADCCVALGTDNVMINSPDLFREMDYTWKVTMGGSMSRIDPAEVLKMVTVNASRLLGIDAGVIRLGSPADAVFIEKHTLDMEPMHNPHAAIVHRASESAVRAVMIGGRVVYGRI